jgi:hypothetical protein
VTAWLRDVRGIDPTDVEDRDLARALPVNTRVPRWAWAPAGNEPTGGTWPALGYRLVVPLYDATGTMVSVRARRVFLPGQEPQDGRPKALGPTGAELRGLVLADALGRLMLAGAPLGDGSPSAPWMIRCGLVISEGEPDFLTWATRWSDANQDAPAVLGVVAGSWCAELAPRVPDDTRVVVRTHGDDAGEKYASAIIRTLHPRCTTYRPKKEAHHAEAP